MVGSLSDLSKTWRRGEHRSDSMTPRFDLVGIVVKDMPAALAFYRRLGLPIPAERDQDQHVEVLLPSGLRLAWDTEGVMASFDRSFDPHVRGGRVSLAFECGTPAGVDQMYRELVAAGYEGHLEPWDAFWGQRYASMRDPDGNSVDLFAPLQT